MDSHPSPVRNRSRAQGGIESGHREVKSEAVVRQRVRLYRGPDSVPSEDQTGPKLWPVIKSTR